MRRVEQLGVWIGNARDSRDIAAIRTAGIRAIVDVAENEPVLTTVARDTMYFRCPLVDGAGNDARLVAIAIGVMADLIRREIPTLVFCSAGMSRSVAIASAAIAVVSGENAEACLARVARGGPCDVSPAVWDQACACVAERIQKSPGVPGLS